MSESEKGLSESGREPGHSGEPVPGDGRCCPERGRFCDEAWAAISQTLGFSPRLGQVARGLVAGQGERQVARVLGLSCKTVDTHVKHLYERLDVHCRIELGMKVSATYHAWRGKSPPPKGCRETR